MNSLTTPTPCDSLLDQFDSIERELEIIQHCYQNKGWRNRRANTRRNTECVAKAACVIREMQRPMTFPLVEPVVCVADQFIYITMPECTNQVQPQNVVCVADQFDELVEMGAECEPALSVMRAVRAECEPALSVMRAVRAECEPVASVEPVEFDELVEMGAECEPVVSVMRAVSLNVLEVVKCVLNDVAALNGLGVKFVSVERDVSVLSVERDVSVLSVEREHLKVVSLNVLEVMKSVLNDVAALNGLGVKFVSVEREFISGECEFVSGEFG